MLNINSGCKVTPFYLNDQRKMVLFLEFDENATVYHASCEVIWHSILMVADVCHPVVTAHIVEPKNIEAIQSQPNVAKGIVSKMSIFVVDESIIHTKIHSLISRCTEGISFKSCMGWAKGEAICETCLEIHFPSCGTREEVGEKEIDVVALVSGCCSGNYLEKLLR